VSIAKFKPSESRSIPCSLEAEKAVLGVALLDDKAIYTARALLTPEEFYPEAHRRIFEAMSLLVVAKNSVILQILALASSHWYRPEPCFTF
jgi:replicative DNA helicase